MHVIRLRAAWRDDGEVAVRRFNRPTGIDGGERVWLAWDGDVRRAEFNGEELDGASSRHDITERLRPGNELRLAAPAEGVRETARLEIEAP